MGFIFSMVIYFLISCLYITDLGTNCQKVEVGVESSNGDVVASGKVSDSSDDGKGSYEVGVQSRNGDAVVSGKVSGSSDDGKGSYEVGGKTDLSGNWQAEVGLGYEFDNGGKVSVSGGVDSSGNEHVGVGASWDWRRKRRSIEDDQKLQVFCQRCISIRLVTSPEEIKRFTEDDDIDFAMVAKFRKIYYNSTDTVLSFKVKEILEQLPESFNINVADVFKIDAKKGVCAEICLKSLLPGKYLVTGEMFNGRLIIHGRILLLHIPKGKKININGD